jgi:hypothetical protein
MIGLLLVLTGVIELIADKQQFNGFCRIIAGLLLIPYTLTWLENAFHHRFEKPKRYALIIILVVFGQIVGSGSRKSKNQNRGNENDTVTTTPIANTKEDQPIERDSSISTTKLDSSAITESTEERQKRIEKQFSPWDGSHMKLVWYVKDNMNDPDSFEHIETSYYDKGSFLIVIMKYRGKNMYGAKVRNYVKAKVDLDGNVLNLIDEGDY